jgi:hypothetical protein
MLVLLELRHVELALVSVDFLLGPYDERLARSPSQKGSRVQKVTAFIVCILTLDWTFAARSMTC